jgi:AcrR family transcriptional regulator
VPYRADQRSSVLIIGHPAHELRVHGWLEAEKPTVFVITDGSGGAGESRIGSTTRILEAAGARRASIYGRYSDRQIYAAILDARYEILFEMVDEIADSLADLRPELVAGDAVEDYNPTHDACRLIINAALEKLRITTGQRPRNYDFLLVGKPDSCPEDVKDEAIWLHLDDAALCRKIDAARTYPEIVADVEEMITKTGGVEPFRTECLRPVKNLWMQPRPSTWTPYYEEYGAKQVAAGRYDRLLRYCEHVLPLSDALREHVMGTTPHGA